MSHLFSVYQDRAMRTCPSGPPDRLVLAALGLAGETGEFVEMVKKHRFHALPLDRQKASKELGDVLWYLTLAADSLGLELFDIATENLAKLDARYPDGFVPGGGNREDDGS